MKPEQDIDDGIIGAAHEAKSNLPYALMCWGIIAMVIVLVFDAGLLVGEKHVHDRIPTLLERHQMVVMQDTIEQIRPFERNRGKYEKLKFRVVKGKFIGLEF